MGTPARGPGRPVVRHRLEAELLLVRNFVEDIELVAPSAESARAAGANWDTCARQLEERALASLPPLRETSVATLFPISWAAGTRAGCLPWPGRVSESYGR